MEVWKDFQTGKYFNLDLTTGLHHLSNKFGKSSEKFVPYQAGYQRELTPKPRPVDSQLALQPRKFDGYSQFPRPFQQSTVTCPFIATKVSPARIRVPEGKLPHPLSYLQATPDKDSPPAGMRLKRRKNSASFNEFHASSIDDLRKLDMHKEVSVVKTKSDLEQSLKKEKLERSVGYFRKGKKSERKKLKGYFRTKFKNSSELVGIEKIIIERTNPVFVKKNVKEKGIEFKRLERKKRATRLLVALNY